MTQSHLDDKKKYNGKSRRKTPSAKRLVASFRGTVAAFSAAVRAELGR